MRTTWPHSVDLPLLSVCQTGVEERAAVMVVEGGVGSRGGFDGCDDGEGLAIVMVVAEIATVAMAERTFDLTRPGGQRFVLRPLFHFWMRPRISITGSVHPSVGRSVGRSVHPSVGDAFVKNNENRCFRCVLASL